jgi:divalent metal cation (Fe/Co/Zn/Cd) transporter
VFNSRIYVDVEIGADAELSLNAAHDIAENVHTEIEKRFPKVKHCNVHINPY